jgi:hypothetical protein
MRKSHFFPNLLRTYSDLSPETYGVARLTAVDRLASRYYPRQGQTCSVSGGSIAPARAKRGRSSTARAALRDGNTTAPSSYLESLIERLTREHARVMPDVPWQRPGLPNWRSDLGRLAT